jgi:aminoglycoside phosphotransferase (APT) family kinase protein
MNRPGRQHSRQQPLLHAGHAPKQLPYLAPSPRMHCASQPNLRGEPMKLHADEVDISSDLVGRLVAEQFPHLADLPVTEFNSTGTVNAIYRLGDDLCVRLPRVRRWARGLERECEWLPRLSPGLTLQVPEPVVKGLPTDEYPFSWAVFRWIDCQPYASDRIDDERRAAADLAQFVAELRSADLPPIDDDTPFGGRLPLAEQDAATRDWIAQAGDLIDGPAVTAAWEDALAGPAWDGTYSWIHSDLLPPNLLVKDGRLVAVIDFGATGVGDPATDLNPAWSIFGQASRTVFRDLVGADDDTWRRGRGIAISQAVGLVPYYVRTNPVLSALGQRMLTEILADVDAH